MKLFNRKWKWKYEIAPMYMELLAEPMTAKQQNFKVMSGLEHPEEIFGDRLPQIGEYIQIPSFNGQFRVRDIRTIGLSRNPNNKSKYSWIVVNLDPAEFGDADYWQIRTTPNREQMRAIEGWRWTTSVFPDNYERFRYEPSDWVDPKLKFKERDFVLQWEKSGSYFMTPKGDEILDLDAKHKYLYDWFPEVREHLDNLKWQK
jgi:hypothetical protein